MISLAASDGALRQRAHFGGDDRKAAAGFARARGLDAGVERKQVGLEGDLVDDADDLGDLARGVLDLAHGRDGLAHDLAGRSASLLASATTALAWRGAFGGLLTVAVISSSAAAVSSSVAACCSVRRDRSSAACEISVAADLHAGRIVGDAAHRLLQLVHRSVEIALQLRIGRRQIAVRAGRSDRRRQAATRLRRRNSLTSASLRTCAAFCSSPVVDRGLLERGERCAHFADLVAATDERRIRWFRRRQRAGSLPR